MKRLILLALWTLSFIDPISVASGANPPVSHEVDPSLINPFYVTGSPHSYRLADTQTFSIQGNGNYYVNWYVDTNEWDFDPQTNHIFSKIEFKKGNTVIGTFVDDEGWSYFGVENSQAKMFKTFKIDNNKTAVVFRGGAYAAGVPKLTIFVISGNQVTVVYNKEYFIGNVDISTIDIKKEINGSKVGFIVISGGAIVIVSDEYPTGKLIY